MSDAQAACRLCNGTNVVPKRSVRHDALGAETTTWKNGPCPICTSENSKHRPEIADERCRQETLFGSVA